MKSTTTWTWPMGHSFSYQVTHLC